MSPGLPSENGIDTAMPCGLLITELVSNSGKRAFAPATRGEVGVKLSSAGEGLYELVVWDNGVGMTTQWDAQQTNSLGLRLVNALVRNLDATMDARVSWDTSTTVRFRRDK